MGRELSREGDVVKSGDAERGLVDAAVLAGFVVRSDRLDGDSGSDQLAPVLG